MNRSEVIAHYCITRADLPHGVQAAQLIHAAGESSPGNLSSHTFAFALVAKDVRDLELLSCDLYSAGIPHKLIFEPDEPWNGQLMAIGVVPGPRKELKKHFQKFALLK